MKQINGLDLKKMLINGHGLLNKNKESINVLNTFPVPDGDTGTNMELTMRSALAELEKVREDSVSSMAGALATGSLLGARGNSGVILSQLFRGFTRALEGKREIGPREFAAALQEGVNTAYKAVMKPVEGTILTVARESAKMAQAVAAKGADFETLMAEVVAHAAAVLEKTPDMLPVLKEAGVVDAGGKGLLHIYEGFLSYFRGEVIEAEDTMAGIGQPAKPQEFFRTEDIKFAYCTELVVKGSRLNPDHIREILSDLGDSLLAVGDDKVVKVHIHSNNPGQVLEKCLLFGTLHDIKIDNMHEQHQEILFESRADEPQAADGIAVIAVSAGEGLAKIFQSLGVNRIVMGGQTMNPSTEDFLQAVNEAPQRDIIILPNNKNIILAAEQVKDLSPKNIKVIKARTIPQGIAAMLAYLPDMSLDENEANMQAAIKKVKSGQVTYAICDSKINGKEIKENDIIAIADDELAAVGKDLEQVLKDLLFKMVDEDSDIITLYSGEAVDRESAEATRDKVAALFPDKEVELYEGGQPLYYYLVSVE